MYDDWYDNEDAGDLGMTSRAGASEAAFEQIEADYNAGECRCTECREEVEPGDGSELLWDGPLCADCIRRTGR